ncbi:MAG: hypothetical protein O4804_04800 [Trichodesmium sp. St11_bin5]|nr:hypothetical protein [Trichodesmium sp. St11_bin5]
MNFSKKIGFCKFNISTSQEFLFDILPDYEGQRNSTKGRAPMGINFLHLARATNSTGYFIKRLPPCPSFCLGLPIRD